MDKKLRTAVKKVKFFLKLILFFDILIINNWLTYAKIIGDESYKEISSDFFFKKYFDDN